MSKKEMRKGQMFLLGALVISSILVIMRYHSSFPTDTAEDGLATMKMESKIIENVVNEINNTIVISYNQPLDISINVFNFANFSEKKMEERSLSLAFMHIGSISNKTTNELNTSIINKIGATQNFSISLGSQEDSLVLDDDSIGSILFSINPGTSYNLTVSYGSVSKTVSINTRTESDVYFGYSSVSLESDSAIHVIDSQKDIYLN